MKKLLLTAAVFTLGANAALACTQEEATAKMQALYAMPEYAAMTAATDTPEDAQKVVAFNTKVGSAGTLAAQGKLDEACAIYDEAKDMLVGASADVQASENPMAEDMEKMGEETHEEHHEDTHGDDHGHDH